MLNSMFLFSKTANKFEVASITALILGLASFIAPAFMQLAGTVLAVVAIWVMINNKTVLKVFLSLATIFVSLLFLGGVVYLFAITLVGVGVAGAVSLVARFVKAELELSKKFQAEADEVIEQREKEQEAQEETFFEMK